MTKTDAHPPRDLSTLFGQWVAACAQLHLARLRGEPEQPDDHWTELKLATVISRELLAGRWHTVAALLRLEAVRSWVQVGEAVDMTGPEACASFRVWLLDQADLFRRTQSTGLSPVQEAELHDRVRAVR